MSVLLNKQRYKRDESVEKFQNFRKFPRRGVACFPSLEYSCISRASLSVVDIRDYSQSKKELAYLIREGYLQEELLSEHIVPGYLNHTTYIYMSTLTFYSFLSLSVVAGFYYGVLC